MSQPEREVRALRNDLALSCSAVRDRLDQVVAAVQAQTKALEPVVAQTAPVAARLVAIDEAVAQLHSDLVAESGVGVQVLGQPVQVEAPSGVAVTNQPDVASVQASVQQGTETANSTAWGILGVLVGFALLVFVFKVVRP
jgi:hypothetical protein